MKKTDEEIKKIVMDVNIKSSKGYDETNRKLILLLISESIDEVLRLKNKQSEYNVTKQQDGEK